MVEGKDNMPPAQYEQKIRDQTEEIARLPLEAADEGPGTPMGRLNAICEFAERELQESCSRMKRCLMDPTISPGI